jgi:Lectin C-type domain
MKTQWESSATFSLSFGPHASTATQRIDHLKHAMKTSLIRALAFVCCLSLQAVFAAPLSGPIVNPANGHTYYLLNQNTWTASEAEAITLGGHLATINNAAENQWIFNTFPQLTGVTQPELWIGFNDLAVEGQFTWTSGEPVTFTFWFPGEPNNTLGLEDYTVIRNPLAAPPMGSWNDLPDNGGGSVGNVFGIVEVIPEPPVYALALLSALGLLAFHYRKKQRHLHRL